MAKMNKRPIPETALQIAILALEQHVAGLTAADLAQILEVYRENADPRRPAPMAESLTKAEVCQAGKCSLATVNRWLSRGQLPFAKVGRLVRIPRAAVEELLSAAMVETPEAFYKAE